MKQDDDRITENPFWYFSLEFYGQSNVASSCIVLQDSMGADVNVLLYCCWIANEGAAAIEPAELVEIIQGIEPWQLDVVSGLRKIRRKFKQNESLDLGGVSKGLLQLIKDCELESERLEQWILFQSGQQEFSGHHTLVEAKVENAKTNLNNYLCIISGGITKTSQEYVHTLGEELRKILVNNAR